MDEVLVIEGGVPLRGALRVGGAKNAALPLMIASLLSAEPSTFENVPLLKDVAILQRLLASLGASTESAGNTCALSTPRITSTEASYGLVKALRASFWVLAPLLAREGRARVSLPGGDIIGARPVDMHLAVLRAMGAQIHVKHGVVDAQSSEGLHAVEFELPFPSVGATHQALMACALVPDESVLRGVAREPEVVALCDMLSQMGVRIDGAGTSVIRIRGERELTGAQVVLPGDRIEAATFLLAAVSTRGELRVEGVDPGHLEGFLPALDALGVKVQTTTPGEQGAVSVACGPELRPLRVQTQPFPGFATDIQAPLVAALATVVGDSVVEERIFEGRFGHISELCRMGAQIQVFGSEARVRGVPKLSGARVEARDIRAGAALVVAALGAEGRSEISDIDHLRRGYSNLEEKLSSVGAQVRVESPNQEDYLFSGCF